MEKLHTKATAGQHHRLCYLSGSDKPLHDLLRCRHRQFSDSHRAHTDKKECRAEALSIHLPDQPGCTFVYAQSAQTHLEVFVRDLLGLHCLDQQQRGYFLPASNKLRLSKPQGLHVAILHGSILSKAVKKAWIVARDAYNRGETPNHTVPTALSQDSHAVILKIPEAVRAAREHFHLGVETLGDPIGPGNREKRRHRGRFAAIARSPC